MEYRRVVALATCLAMAACTTRPDNISPTYISPVSYQNFTCAQMAEEKRRVSSELAKMIDAQYENANADAMMLAVGIVFLPVVALGMFATKDRKEQIGLLKGHNQALDEAMRTKGCAPPPPPAAPAPSVSAPAPTPGGPAPKCKDVGGYEAYKARTGQVCDI